MAAVVLFKEYEWPVAGIASVYDAPHAHEYVITPGAVQVAAVVVALEEYEWPVAGIASVYDAPQSQV